MEIIKKGTDAPSYKWTCPHCDSIIKCTAGEMGHLYSNIYRGTCPNCYLAAVGPLTAFSGKSLKSLLEDTPKVEGKIED